MNTDKSEGIFYNGKKNSWLWDEDVLRNDELNRVVPLEEIQSLIEKQRVAGWFRTEVDEETAAPGLFPVLRRVMRRMFQK